MSGPTPRLRGVLIGAAVMVAACTPSPAVVSPTSTPPTQSSAAEVGNLPPGCDPIDLRTPAGEAVDLAGIWIQDDEGGRLPSKWWIRTEGDCIWGTGIADNYTEQGLGARPDSVQTLHGTIDNDFSVDGTIALLGPHPAFAVLQYSTRVRMDIVVDATGGITLREDRVPGVQGPRCPDAVGYCPPPLLLRPQQ